MKKATLILYFILPFLALSQNKKEQIIILTNRVDSCNFEIETQKNVIADLQATNKKITNKNITALSTIDSLTNVNTNLNIKLQSCVKQESILNERNSNLQNQINQFIQLDTGLYKLYRTLDERENVELTLLQNNQNSLNFNISLYASYPEAPSFDSFFKDVNVKLVNGYSKLVLTDKKEKTTYIIELKIFGKNIIGIKVESDQETGFSDENIGWDILVNQKYQY